MQHYLALQHNIYLNSIFWNILTGQYHNNSISIEFKTFISLRQKFCDFFSQDFPLHSVFLRFRFVRMVVQNRPLKRFLHIVLSVFIFNWISFSLLFCWFVSLRFHIVLHFVCVSLALFPVCHILIRKNDWNS